MEEDENESKDDVDVTLELVGKYDRVMDKLRDHGVEHERINVVAADLVHLLSTLDRTEGGTKSVIADALPTEMAVEYDADTVVDALKLLERYGLVELEGNTWRAVDGAVIGDGYQVSDGGSSGAP